MPASKVLRKIRTLVIFVGYYFFDLVFSAFRIARAIVKIKIDSKSGFIDVRLDATTDLEIAVVANLITFSPGTMVVGLSDDRKFMRIHVMLLDDPAKIIQQIKSDLELRVLEILR